jgi:GT2 family glycosyltransferase/2-polyprenyl-3-methyl-5-hydroxy-6-metoxy-1,4-benzoquinol methylase
MLHVTTLGQEAPMTSSRAHLYDARIDLSKRDSHTLMAEAAFGRARVLDVGCATGALGAVLKAAGSFVVGVEVDADAARVASSLLDEVLVGDVESEPFFDQFPAASFDAVLFGDVLEHLRRPEAALERVRRLLRPGGVVVASIPNVAHAAVRLALLSGAFDYSPTGLLDETHIRFFTRATVKKLFDDASFAVVNVERTLLGPFDTEIELDPAAFPWSLVTAVQGSPEATTYQFVVTAEPAEGASTVSGASVWGERDRGPQTFSEGLFEEDPRLAGSLVRAVAELATMMSPLEETAGSEIPPYEFGPDANSDPGAYQLWLKDRQGARLQERRVRREALSSRHDLPTVSIVVPVYRPDLDLLARCVESVRRQDLPVWELCLCDDGSGNPDVTAFLDRIAGEDPRILVTANPTNQGISGASNSAASLARSEFLAFLDQDDELEPGALAEVVEALDRDPEIDVLYTDEDKLTEKGVRVEPFFKSDWSPDQLLSHMYIGHLFVLRRSLFERVGRLRSRFDGSQDYDLALRATEQARQVLHLQTVAYHWRKTPESTAMDYGFKPGADLAARDALLEAMQRRQVDATVESGIEESTFRVRRALTGTPLVSVIVPFHNGGDLLQQCVRSLQETAGYANWEAILVDNRSWEPETRAVVNRLVADPRCRVVSYPHDFNWAALNNFAAEHAEGDHLLFLNVDVVGTRQGWLSAMVEQSQRPEVGVVGARLLYPDGRIQHAGVIMGLGGGVAGHAFCYCPPDRIGYYFQDRIIRNYSAVTGACMMVPRPAFEASNGFDEDLTIAYNDIDFCLRLREKGYLVVYTPFAELIHEESAARGRSSCELGETNIMFRRWGGIIRRDPYFNPNLDARRHEFALAMGGEEDDPWGSLESTAVKWWNESGMK